MSKKRNFLQKFWLKISDPIAYCREYKNMDIVASSPEEPFNPHKNFEFLAKEFNERLPFLPKKQNPPFSFSHSGHIGDLIYSLPVVKALSMGVPVDFFVELNYPAPYTDEQHPTGNVRINNKTYEMLYPLLSSQSFIQNVNILDNENTNVDYNLDIFRELPIYSHRGSNVRAYFYTFNTYYDINLPWIEVTANKSFKDKIVFSHSIRYNSPHINYAFLSKYDNVVFLGTENEYDGMKKIIPNLVFQPINNFLEMAEIIAGSKFFIGNQSFPYSLAEALKVPRLLELFYYIPDIIPYGANGHDFYFQSHLEYLVKKLNK